MDEKKDLLSLNEKLYNEFSIEELEERLETDPFFMSNFLISVGESNMPCACNRIENCSDRLCGCDGDYGGSGCACKKIPNCAELICGCNGDN